MAEPAGVRDRARVGGSGFTVFVWDIGGETASGATAIPTPIAFARQVSHQSPQPVGPGTTPIHPLDSPYPKELITPQAATMGAITLELYELYGAQVWERLDGLAGQAGKGPVDIVGIFQAVANTPNPIRIIRYVKPPKIRGRVLPTYTEEYNNCVVSQVLDGETIEIGTMEVVKQMVINYTHVTRNGRNPILSGQSTNVPGNPTEGTTTAFS